MRENINGINHILDLERNTLVNLWLCRFFTIYQLIRSQCTLYLSPENMFSGGRESVHWEGMS